MLFKFFAIVNIWFLFAFLPFFALAADANPFINRAFLEEGATFNERTAKKAEYKTARLYFSEVSSSSFSVILDTGGQAVNTLEAYIAIPGLVTGVSNSDSPFSINLEPAIENSATSSVIKINAFDPYPGVSGTIRIATVNFEASTGGSIYFLNSSVLANDGFGTDILAATTSSYL